MLSSYLTFRNDTDSTYRSGYKISTNNDVYFLYTYEVWYLNSPHFASGLPLIGAVITSSFNDHTCSVENFLRYKDKFNSYFNNI